VVPLSPDPVEALLLELPELPELLVAPELEELEPCWEPDDPDELPALELEPPVPELLELPLELVDSVDPPSPPEELSFAELFSELSFPLPVLLDPEPAHAGTRHVAPRTAKKPHGESHSDVENTGDLLFGRMGGVFASSTQYANPIDLYYQ
jgi:hypothetical protein